MNTNSPLFAQVISHLSNDEFRRSVNKYKGNKGSKGFSCWDQFLCMAFAQLTYRESLRDIEACLRSQGRKLYHLGIRGNVSRSTLAYANNTRDWRIYENFAYKLIAAAQKLYAKDDFGIELSQSVYALDSTTIDLCLRLFPWAKFRSTKAGIKLHTLLNLRGNIPSFISISAAKMADLRVLDELQLEPGAFYIMDRGYVDFKRFYKIERSKAIFVTRAKKHMSYRIHHSEKLCRGSAVRKDQRISLLNRKAFAAYPAQLRRIEYYDSEYDRTLIFITNEFLLPAAVIAQLYKARWKVELFFKWIKQHLRIKAFFGTSENAVRTQVWIAISVYVLVAIVKKRLKSSASLHSILAILSVNALTKMPIFTAFSSSHTVKPTQNIDNQLILQELYLGQ